MVVLEACMAYEILRAPSAVVVHTLYPAVCLGLADRMGLVPSVKMNQKDTLVPAGTMSGGDKAGSWAIAPLVVTVAVSRVVQGGLVRTVLSLVPLASSDPLRKDTRTAKDEAPEG